MVTPNWCSWLEKWVESRSDGKLDNEIVFNGKRYATQIYKYGCIMIPGGGTSFPVTCGSPRGLKSPVLLPYNGSGTLSLLLSHGYRCPCMSSQVTTNKERLQNHHCSFLPIYCETRNLKANFSSMLQVSNKIKLCLCMRPIPAIEAWLGTLLSDFNCYCI